MNAPNKMSLLWLLQLSDSALPIGALSHSFGLETLAMQESLTAEDLELFLHDYLKEVVGLEIHFCGAAYQLGRRDMGPLEIQSWLDLNAKLGAFKMARESRTASGTLGRRFIHLVDSLADLPVLQVAIDAARRTEVDVYHCTAFGLASAALGIEEEATLLGYGHQALANLISVCQRLLPVGQTQASPRAFGLCVLAHRPALPIVLSYRGRSLDKPLSTPETRPATSFLCRLFLPRAGEDLQTRRRKGNVRNETKYFEANGWRTHIVT
jgi:urease accessory protein